MAMKIEIRIKASGEVLIMQEFKTMDEAMIWLNRFAEIIEKEVE